MENLSLREMRMGATVTVANGIEIATGTLAGIESVTETGIDETGVGIKIAAGVMLVVSTLQLVAFCVAPLRGSAQFSRNFWLMYGIW